MTKFLIISLSAVILILLALNIIKGLSGSKKSTLPSPVLIAPSSSPTASPSPTFNPLARMPLPKPADLKPLQVVSVEPKEDLSRNFNPVTEVKFTFSDELADFPVDISPDTKVRVTTDTATHSYTISPISSWPNGITTFIVKQGVKSVRGATLESTFTYKINFQDPKNPPDDAAL